MESFISMVYIGISMHHALNNDVIDTLCYVAIAAAYLAAYHIRRREEVGAAAEEAPSSEGAAAGEADGKARAS